MDPKNPILKHVPILLILAGVSIPLLVVVFPSLLPQAGSQHQIVSRWSFSHWVVTYRQAWHSVQDKVQRLQQADEERNRLRLENGHLKLELETQRFEQNEKFAKNTTAGTQTQLSQATGDRVGQVLAAIQYQPPSHLQPAQLHALGVSYFQGKENEKAAVIFSVLSQLKDIDDYRTEKHHLLTGMTWYRLANYILASSYFDEILKSPESPIPSIQKEKLVYHAQALLWKALVEKRLKKETSSQFWLKDLVDHHPQSDEATWVNSRSGHHD